MANLTMQLLGAVAQPTGVWETLIMAFHNGIPNYAWAIIVFTIVIKLVMLPFDLLNKYVTAKNTRVQKIIQPELDKIQKQYGNNKQVLNQKTMELYKKHNYNVTGSCLVMLFNMALTLFIFITLFNGLNSMASYKVQYQYEEIQKSYYSTVTEYQDKETVLEEMYKKHYIFAINDNKTAEEAATYAKEQTKAELELLNSETTNTNALNRYNEVKESWLWIDNIWKPDTPWTNSVASFDEYSNSAKATFKDYTFALSTEENAPTATLSANDLKELAKVEYNQIMDPIRESAGRENGYLIVVILAAGLNVLSILATQGKLKFKKKTKPTTLEEAEPKQKKSSGILMLILLPALMIYITMSYNAVFGLYILVSSLVGTATTPLINWLVGLIEKRKENKKKAKEVVVSYSRKKK